MKKLNWPVIIALALFLGAIALYLRSMSEPPKEKHTPPRTNVKTNEAPAEEVKVNDRVVVGKMTEEQKKKPETIKPQNKPSPHWEKELQKSLISIGGETIQNVAVKKVASVILMKNYGGINAESVIITLKNKEGAESSFRALIDSASGRIIETWDRTIFEPVGHRDHHEHSIIDYQPYYED